MAKLLAQDLMSLESVLVGSKEKHLKWSAIIEVDKLTNSGVGVLDFNV